jgi:hypothetical protein
VLLLLLLLLVVTVVTVVMLLLQTLQLLLLPGPNCAAADVACVFIRMGKHLLQQIRICQFW